MLSSYELSGSFPRFAVSTLRCVINRGDAGRVGGGGRVKIKARRGRRFLSNFISGGVGISRNPLISVINEKRNINV